jgi:hypothetical protein
VHNDGDRATVVAVELSLDGSDVALPGLTSMTRATADMATGWVRSTPSASLEDLLAPPGATLAVRWRFDDGAGVGARDEVGLDRVVVGARIAGTDARAVTEPATPTLLALGLTVLALRGHRPRLQMPRMTIFSSCRKARVTGSERYCTA